MIKKPYTYLFYAIIALILFIMGLYGLITQYVDEWYIVLIPFAISVMFFVLFFLKK